MLEFGVNAEGAFVGFFDWNSGGSAFISNNAWFIATPLLPCSIIDKKIEKYTGNNGTGRSPQSNITSVIHCFAHYCYLVSNRQWLFCDLQGMRHIRD